MDQLAQDVDLEDVECEIRRGSWLPRFSPKIEQCFEADTGASRCRGMIRQNYVGMVIYHGFLISDFHTIGDVFVLNLWIHFGLMMPLMLGVNCLLKRRPRRWIRESLALLLPIVLASTVVWVVLSSRAPDRDCVLLSLVLVVQFMVTMQKIQFGYCVVGCLFIQLFYLFGSLNVGDLSAERIMVGNSILVGAVTFSLVGAYNLERELRMGYLLTLRDRFRNCALEIASLCDALTGLGNRRALDADLSRLATRRLGEPVRTTAFCLLDIDHFKAFNDTNGHQEGDACLKRVAALVAASIRPDEGRVYRFGGEEFLILLDDIEPDGALAVAERVRSNVASARIPRDSAGAVFVTVSIGVAFGRLGRDIAPDALIAAADSALYTAKRGGRNRVWPSTDRDDAASIGAGRSAAPAFGASALKEWISPALLAERARGAVAGNEGDVVAEGQKLFVDGSDQLLVVAAR